MWSCGTLEKLIVNVQQAIVAIEVKGLQYTYKKLEQAKTECMDKLDEVVLNCDLVEGEVKEGSAL